MTGSSKVGAVIVTGGSRGIGAAITRRFLEIGRKVVVADILEPCDELADVFGAHSANAAVYRRTDVTSAADVADLLAAVGEVGLRPEVLVNNAAVYQDIGQKSGFDEVDEESWDRVMQVNVKGTWLMTRAVFPSMRMHGRGRVINIASSTFHMGVPGFVHYTASKGAVIAMTRSIAREVGLFGITVNAVAPGLTDTEATRLVSGVRHIASTTSRQAVPRVLDASDLVGTVEFLASDAASMMTGQTLIVDGGIAFS